MRSLARLGMTEKKSLDKRIAAFESPSTKPLPIAEIGSVSSENQFSRDEQCLKSLVRREKLICAGTVPFQPEWGYSLHKTKSDICSFNWMSE